MLPGGTPPLTCQKPHISSQQTAGRDSCLEVAILHLRLRNGSQMVGYSETARMWVLSQSPGRVRRPQYASFRPNYASNDIPAF